MTNTRTRTITVRTSNNESRRVRIPSDVLLDGKRTSANQISTGIFETDTYVSPRGIVISRRYSLWDTGHGCEGTHYYQISDPIRLAEEFGIEPKEIPTL